MEYTFQNTHIYMCVSLIFWANPISTTVRIRFPYNKFFVLISELNMNITISAK